MSQSFGIDKYRCLSGVIFARNKTEEKECKENTFEKNMSKLRENRQNWSITMMITMMTFTLVAGWTRIVLVISR